MPELAINRGLTGRVAAIVVAAFSLGACASLGDETFTASGADTGAPAVATAYAAPGPVPAAPSAGAAGASTGSTLERHPNAVLEVAVDDPFEDFNRVVFHINDSVDTHIIVPVARAYRVIVPEHARNGIRNAFANIASPVTFANDVFQGEWGRAHVTFHRFAINSTFGVAGLHDVASSEFGLQPHVEDFDQTLALGGVESGPYLVLPLLGPGTPRHVVGRVVDSLTHPLTWALASTPVEYGLVQRGTELVSTRADLIDPLEQIRNSSPDYYAAVRSLYRQSRQSEISNGQLSVAQEGTDLDDDLDLGFD